MGRWPARAAASLLVLAATTSVAVGGTLSAYTDNDSTGASSFTATSDWAAPTIPSAVIGRSTAYDTGTIHQGATYYVYANVTDTGDPSSGIASVTANVNLITTGSTAVALVAGSYSAGGVSYNYRSASKVANSTLTAGSKSFTVTAVDNDSNSSGAQSYTVTVDNTAPAGSDIQTTDVSGGTTGKVEQGDTVTLTYNSTIDPYSIFSGWTGASTPVQVALVDGGGSSDYIVVYSPSSTPTQLPLGTIYLTNTGYVTSGYVTYGLTGSATPSTMVRNGASITITLGTASATTTRVSTAAKMTWIPSASATDIAGNAASTTTVTQSGTTHVNF
jgi:hypothetical protein